LHLSGEWWMATKQTGDWGEYRSLILAELKRLSEGIEGVKLKIDSMHTTEIGDLKAQMAVLQFKSGVWGLIAGAIPSAIAVIYVLLHK